MPTNGSPSPHRPRELSAALTLAALGIVFGDIGTSPLYALRECFSETFGLALTQENVFGILSLIFWSLNLIVSMKYLSYVMRAENHGEGGVLALMALAQPHHALLTSGARRWLVFGGIFGAGLLFGDGIITPAISVLSAVEGLRVINPDFDPFIVPLTITILILLFSIQKRGTGKLGALFGPIVLLWFCLIGLLGVSAISAHPEILGAINPAHAVQFFLDNGRVAFLALGAVFLVVTGAEALYADMGHFGPKPIRAAWFLIALPGLLLNYFGQGALLLAEPEAIESPFYRLCPPALLVPMVVLATIVTVIASQALISGVFSLTSQAMKLGLLPRMQITHTSRDEIGQIYVSRVNWALLILTIWLVLEFRDSSSLAAAYGVAVSLTMLVTTGLTFFVSREVWRWPLAMSLGITVFFLIIEAGFFAAAMSKVIHGGWVPLVIGALVLVLMTTWRRGRQILNSRLREKLPPFEEFVQEIPSHHPAKVPGVAVYMSAQAEFAPPALLYNLQHNKVLHSQVVVLLVVIEEIPFVSPVRRVEVESLSEGLYRVRIHYGFMEQPDIPRALGLCKGHGLELDLDEATYFFGRESLLATRRPGMALWREHLFAFMSQNAQKAPRFFRIKADQVIEIGYEVEL